VKQRIVGLDGIRGVAALYVVVHHCWLLTFPGYPANTGPQWLGWLLHGRFAVVVFITLSGFSLAIAPARDGWRLGGVLRFARRRARRILPTYWAALGLSLMIAAAVTPLPLSAPPSVRSVVVYGLLMQDVTVAPVPNGAFWSIAVEAGLYLAFPLLLLIRRRAGAVTLLAAVTVPVVAIGLLRPDVSTTAKATGFTLELAPLFTLGLVAAGVVTARARIRRLPWHWLAALAAAPVALLIVHKGSAWTVHHYYWIDLAIGPAIAMSLAAVATRRPASGPASPGLTSAATGATREGGASAGPWARASGASASGTAPLTWLLATRPALALGGFSFSLYLIHLPIVAMISRRLVAPHVAPGLPAFWVTLVVAVPVCVAAAWLFGRVFETPFQSRHSPEVGQDPPPVAVDGDCAAVRKDPLRPRVAERDADADDGLRVVAAHDVDDRVALGGTQPRAVLGPRAAGEVGDRRPAHQDRVHRAEDPALAERADDPSDVARRENSSFPNHEDHLCAVSGSRRSHRGCGCWD
jgi:peptidoglycan/LPS O-acetylase OafA/YrhL